MDKKILIVGSTGLLGPYFIEQFCKEGQVFAYGFSKGSNQADFTILDNVRSLIKKIEPDIVVNLAGYTDVDGCESNPGIAQNINTNIPSNIVQCISKHTKFIQISTDQVYPNTSGPHNEKDTGPINVYGKTKLSGEKAAKLHDNTLILRINLFGRSKTKGRKSLSDFFEESFRSNRHVKLYTDSIFSPLHMSTIAEITRKMISRNIIGTYNLGSGDSISKSNFALAIADHFSLSTESSEEASSVNVLNRVGRSLDLSLNISKIEKVLSQSLPTIKEEIKKL